MKYKVNEVFTSIQGEGPDVGQPANFIRLAGCNLKCGFCDTVYNCTATLTVDEIIARMDPKVHLVVITGGEPFLHNLAPLVKELNITTHRVTIESNGTLAHGDDLMHHGGYSVVVSPKEGTTLHPNVIRAQALKYIISTDTKLCPEGLPLNAPRVSSFNHRLIYLQPMDESEPMTNSMNMGLVAELCIKHGYRYSLQTHKIIGVR
ncbi:7-carboxy-7-deazaguanine synthase QueE [Candidatus Pacearchaeota archaeon]|nr:7-carboxy-7-deazaguanine synthase QueE [Candidatus Pacearchaeota archaeon]